MMNTSKIQTVVKTDNTWQAASGTMYDYTVTLEDGTTGTASSTSPEAPPYGVGDEVEYTKKETKFGWKLKIKKANNFSPSSGGGFKRSPEDQKKMENSWALGTAVQVLGKCPVDEVSVEQWLKDCAEVARMLLVKRDTLN
jgi:hypothetical protein